MGRLNIYAEREILDVGSVDIALHLLASLVRR